MIPDPSLDIPSKPRVLIADDSRIVRASLIKHIQGMFQFREALDGEQAWETLLIDPSIRVVITDLTMPKLDGYGLLKRIRSSEISRIRNIPVVVVSGSDEEAERDRAKAAGATDLITKGIGTPQLLSRLEILSNLAHTQRDFERSLEEHVSNGPVIAPILLAAPEVLEAEAEAILARATQSGKNFCVLHISLGLKHIDLNGNTSAPPASVVSAIGQLLQRTIREIDRVAQTAESEFTLVTESVNVESAHSFARRMCRVISKAHALKPGQMTLIVSCGLATLSEQAFDAGFAMPGFNLLQEIAQRRALFGLHHAINGVVGEAEELAYQANYALPDTAQPDAPAANDAIVDPAQPDVATLLQWIKEGKQDQVMQHLGGLSAELQPLVDLMLRQKKIGGPG